MNNQYLTNFTIIKKHSTGIQQMALIGLFLLFSGTFLFAQTTVTITATGLSTWKAPACVNSIDIQMWGGGGAGGGEPGVIIGAPAAGGGGGGGAFAGKTGIPVVAGTTYNITVGAGGAGGQGNGNAGGASTATFGGTTITAAGGSGGGSGSNGAGGAGGVAGVGGFSGGTGSAGVNGSHGGGAGGGAGSTANGSNALVNGNGGSGGATGGGLGGSGGASVLFGLVLGSSGTSGATYGGGGGSGNRGLLLASVTSSRGANGAVIITYNVGATPTMTSASTTTMCTGNSLNIPLAASVSSIFTWIASDNPNTSGESTTLKTSGTTTDAISDNISNNSTVDQTVTYTVIPTAVVGGCVGLPQVVTVTVRPMPVLSSTLTPSAICTGTTFTYNATSIAPSPVFSWVRPTIAGITEPGTSGTGNISEVLTNNTTVPVNATYVYTITSGACFGNSENVVVAVNSDATIVLTSGAGTNTNSVCLNAAITDITYSIGGGATGAIVAGLPPGVGGNYNAGVFTISGTPTTAGVYNYTVTATGACIPAIAEGTITSGIALTSVSGTDSQRVCIGTPIATITYAMGGAGSGATVSGLPTGVLSSFSSGTVTISGTPNVSGTYIYTVSATGPCAPDVRTGSITIGLGLLIPGTDTQRVCKNQAIIDIPYTIIGGDSPIPTAYGLPPGLSGSITAPGVFTISGSPTVEGYYAYAVTTNGTCGSQSTLTGIITVGLGLVSVGTDTQNVCKNNPILDIVYSFAGGDATAPMVTGLPAGVSGSITNPGEFTISGSPSVEGVFVYSLSTNGSCAPQSTLGGRITIGLGLASNTATDTQRVCKNDPIVDIIYTFGGGNGTAPTVTGLPPGVNGSVTNPGEFTISGTPTQEGTFIYTITTSGTCVPQSSLSGSITSGLGLVISGADYQSVCKGEAIVNIDYTVVGGDVPPPTVTGLPAGVSGSISSPGIFTISGTPVAEGMFNYSVKTNGTCASQSTLTGSLAVGMQLTSGVGTDTQNVCKNTPIVDITYAFAGGDIPAPTMIGLPAGVSGSISSPGVYTITGIPTVAGTFNYALSTNGSCVAQSTLGGRITVGLGLKVSGRDTQSVCKNTPLLDIVYRVVGGDAPVPTVTGLPAGVTGSITGAGEFSISGTPTAEGAFVYTVTTGGTCAAQSSLSGLITVGLGLQVPGTDDQSVCKNTPITDIVYAIVGGDVPPPTVTGLPPGVTGSITAAGIFTISGTPTMEGLFNYSVQTNGSCASQSTLTGSIAVGMKLSSAIGTDTQQVCISTPIVTIAYAYAGGDVLPPTITGLPPGVSGGISGPGVYTISGTPTVEGTYNYALTTHGSCAVQSTLGGRITVGLGLKVPGRDTQSICKNTPILDIVYRVVGGDTPLPTVSGLPAGVSGSITAAGEFTISGTPTAEGTFIYTVTTAGTCNRQSSLSGSITVGLGLKVPGTNNQSVCKGVAIITIDYAIVGGDVPPPTVTGLPAGVMGSISSPGIFTISGTPVAEGMFNYAVTTQGTCASQSTLTGSLAVGVQLTSAIGTDTQAVCKNTPIVNITYAFAGGNTPAPTIIGLPAGVTGSISSPGIYKISGTPTVEGTFDYVLSTHGSCATQSSLGGRITVGLGLKTPGTNIQSICETKPIVDIIYSVVGGDVPAPTVIGLPPGVTGSITGPGIFTIKGTPTLAGTFNYTVTTKGSCVSQSSLSGSITVGLGLKVPGTDHQIICKNTPIVNIVYAFVGGDVPPPVVTGLPSGVTGSITAPGIFTIKGTPTVEGTFNYAVTTKGSCSTQSTLNGSIIINNAAISLGVAGINNQKICNKTPITNIAYIVGGSATGATVSALPKGMSSSYSGGIFTISGSPDTVSGTYVFTVNPTGSCSQGATTFTITVTSPKADFTYDPDSGNPSLQVNFTNNSVDATHYEWLYGNGDSDTTFNATYTFTKIGVYDVMLIASFDSQCPDTATHPVTVYKFIVPNTFTPNGDGVNDVLLLNYDGLETLDMEIYNRWGVKMAEWHSIGGGWDGTNTKTDKPCSDGTYFYLVKAKDIDGGEYSEKGMIILIR